MKRAKPKRYDPAGPAKVRQRAGEGPTAVSKLSWRDPDDMRPNARYAREVHGYRTYCPLRRMALQRGSQITERHIKAADRFRSQADLAIIGAGGSYDLLVTHGGFGPSLGPSAAAIETAAAALGLSKALRRVPPVLRPMLVEVVLLNRSLQTWCLAAPVPLDAKIEMGRLLALLALLVDHYGPELDAEAAIGEAVA